MVLPPLPVLEAQQPTGAIPVARSDVELDAADRMAAALPSTAPAEVVAASSGDRHASVEAAVVPSSSSTSSSSSDSSGSSSVSASDSDSGDN